MPMTPIKAESLMAYGALQSFLIAYESASGLYMNSWVTSEWEALQKTLERMPRDTKHVRQ